MQMTRGRVKLIAACDKELDRLRAFSMKYGVANQLQEPDALIAAADIDLVVVATPPSSHEVIVVAALDAGKYVLCEKPLAHSLISARKITEAEKRHPGKLSVCFQFRYRSDFRRVDWIVKNGWLGNLRSALIERH